MIIAIDGSQEDVAGIRQTPANSWKEVVQEIEQSLNSLCLLSNDPKKAAGIRRTSTNSRKKTAEKIKSLLGPFCFSS